MTEIRIASAARLRDLMGARHLSQQQVADAIGVAQTTVSNYLRGASVPKVEELHKLAELFGVPIHVLLGTPERGPDNNFFFTEDQNRALAVLVNGMSKTTGQAAQLVVHGCVFLEPLAPEVFREHSRIPDGAPLVRAFRPAHAEAPLNALLEFPNGELHRITLHGQTARPPLSTEDAPVAKTIPPAARGTFGALGNTGAKS